MGIQKDMSKYKGLMVKSNYIIEASYKLSLQEQRLIYILTTKIEQEDVNFKPYRLAVKEFADILGVKNKNIYSEVAKYIESLRHRDLTIIKENSILKTTWLSSAEYFTNEGYVELEFSPKLKPYLLQLKERFTKLDFKNVINFNSNYSCRVYELLKQYERIGERTLKLDDLKTMFCIEPNEYKLYADFKRKVILQAQKEINSKTDIYFEFQEIKSGKKVTTLKFIINRQPMQTELGIVNDSDILYKPVQNIISTIRNITGIDITEEAAYEIYENAKKHKKYKDYMELIKEVAEYSKSQNIKNSFVGWFKTAVKAYERPVKKNRVDNFNKFDQRTIDFDSLEKKLLGWDTGNLAK